MALPSLRSATLIRALARFDKLGIEQSHIKKRCIMTTRARLDKVLETIQKNPYYDKYAEKIAKLQQTSPEEFLQRVEQQEKKAREKEVPQRTCKLSGIRSSWLCTSLLQKSNSLQGQNIRKRYVSTNGHNMYVTTPIFYVNAEPHIGHLYTVALADAISRYHEMLGHSVYLSTGTDEHGTKVQIAAEKAGLPASNYCDKVSGTYENMCKNFKINYTRFLRTTEPHHRETVHQFWNILEEKGHIYLGQYSGWYCASDEAFLSEMELVDKKDKNGNDIKVSPESGHPVEWTEENNYKFRLSAFQDDLKHWLKDEKTVRPSMYHKILSRWVEEGECLQDLSISRPINRMPWGIPTPKDNLQNIYVWFDALVNYLSTLDYPSPAFKQLWPPSIQIIGKDILKFHGVYWPAFLIAAGLEPPRTLLCHSHWLVKSEKMSKSKHNVVSPFTAAQEFTDEGLRYFLLREAVPTNDANYEPLKVRHVLDSELSGTLGNLVRRCTVRSMNPIQVVPNPANYRDLLRSDVATRLIAMQCELGAVARRNYDDCHLHHVVDAAMGAVREAHRLVDYHRPWDLARQPDSVDEVHAVLGVALESARLAGLVLRPIIPERADYLLDHLGVPANCRGWDDTEARYTRNRHDDASCAHREAFMLHRSSTARNKSAIQDKRSDVS